MITDSMPPWRRRAHGPVLASAIYVSAALLLAGCGARTSVTSDWQEPRSSLAPFTHPLVIGVSPNLRLRRSFETALAEAIAIGPTRASTAIASAGPNEPLTRQTVSEMIRATGADSVLVTRLVSRRVALDEDPGRVGVKVQRTSSQADAPGLIDLFSQTYNEYEEPGELTARSRAVLISELYEATEGGRLVYSITTTVEFTEGRDDFIGAVTTAIARQLRRDGLVR